MRPHEPSTQSWTAPEQATQTYVIPEPFERALKQVRESLAREGLSVPCELDLSARLRQQVGLSVPPCKLL